MPVNDFLFEGRPPPSVGQWGQTVESMPKWLSDYTKGMIDKANVIAAEPYQQYGGPRIAGFAPEEEQGFDIARGTVGAYQPYLAAAGLTLGGGLEQAGQYLGEGTRGFPGAVDEYMDPYIGHVLNRQAELAQRQFGEETLPQLQSAFTRAGHFGSDRMMEMAERATRQSGESLTGQQLAALSAGYGQAGELYGADASRALQAAGISGELGVEGARGFGALGEMATRMGYGDAAAMEAIGRTQRGMEQGSLDLAYGDFLRQNQYPRETIDWMGSVIRGLPYSTAQQTAAYGPMANLDYAPSGASQLGSLLTAGAGIYDTMGWGKAEGGLIEGPLEQYAKGGTVSRKKGSVRERKINNLVREHGVDRVTAAKIVDGLIKHRVK